MNIKMSLKIIVCFFSVIILEVFSASHVRTKRIVGGIDTDIKELPHQVSFRYVANNLHFCGGAIISEFHILTAAHCVKDLWPPYSNVKVFMGTKLSNSKRGTSFKILLVQMHPNYTGQNQTSFHNDIAVVTLDGCIKFNNYQKKIELPSKNVEVGDTALISGWGFQCQGSGQTSVMLQKAQLTIVRRSDCQRSIGRVIHKEQICAFKVQGVGGCNGDSGGPLTANGKIIGVISFVVPCAMGVPDVFTNVYSYLGFIKERIEPR